MAIKYECRDFLMFQESLKKMREVDDKIIYALNTSLPTESFKGQVNAEKTCSSLFEQLQVAHNQREDALKRCIITTAETVKDLKQQKEKNPDDIALDKNFKSEQRKLRMLRSEVNVEDIIKARTYKTFNERCRLFLNIPAL